MVARPARKRMYRTMQGRMVDIEKLRAANESVRAVGNMNVNARGDVLGPGGPAPQPTLQQVDLSAPTIKPAPEQAVETFKPKTTTTTTTDKKGIDAALDGLE